MIKPGEYIQLLMFFQNSVNWNFITQYSAYEMIEPIETCKRLDELRVLHNKYKLECEKYDVYAHLDLTQMEMLIEDIKRICKEFKIRYDFNTKGNIEYKAGIHVNYYHEQRKITNLIVFYQTRKPSHISH